MSRPAKSAPLCAVKSIPACRTVSPSRGRGPGAGGRIGVVRTDGTCDSLSKRICSSTSGARDYFVAAQLNRPSAPDPRPLPVNPVLVPETEIQQAPQEERVVDAPCAVFGQQTRDEVVIKQAARSERRMHQGVLDEPGHAVEHPL